MNRVRLLVRDQLLSALWRLVAPVSLWLLRLEARQLCARSALMNSMTRHPQQPDGPDWEQ